MGACVIGESLFTGFRWNFYLGEPKIGPPKKVKKEKNSSPKSDSPIFGLPAFFILSKYFYINISVNQN